MVVGYRLSVVGYQLSVISYRLSGKKTTARFLRSLKAAKTAKNYKACFFWPSGPNPKRFFSLSSVDSVVK